MDDLIIFFGVVIVVGILLWAKLSSDATLFPVAVPEPVAPPGALRSSSGRLVRVGECYCMEHNGELRPGTVRMATATDGDTMIFTPIPFVSGDAYGDIGTIQLTADQLFTPGVFVRVDVTRTDISIRRHLSTQEDK